MQGPDVLTVRDALAVVAAVVTFLGAALYALTWREITASRKRGNLHANWLTDHEIWNVQQGKPGFDPKD